MQKGSDQKAEEEHAAFVLKTKERAMGVFTRGAQSQAVIPAASRLKGLTSN